MKKFLSLFLAFVMILSAAIGMASCGKDDVSDDGAFNFAKEKMDKYISLDRSDYIGVDIEVDVNPEITKKDVDEYVDYILESVAERKTLSDVAVEDGDVVALYFRGVCDGVEFEGGSNMSDKTPASLEIGSGMFIPGFEEALIGIVPNTTAFTRIDSGTIKGDYVVYVSYSYTYKDETGEEKKGEVKEERIDLADTGKDIFASQIIGKTIGTEINFDADIDLTGDGVKENASIKLKVTFAAIEEATPITVTFPDPYKSNEELSGKEAVFYVVIKDLARKNIPEFTADLITGKLGYKSEAGATGDALVEEYCKYIEEGLKQNRATQIENLALDKLFASLYEKAVVKEYPEQAVAEATAYYKEALKSTFEQYKAYYSDFPYETEAEFAPDFFGPDFNKEADFEVAIDEYAKLSVLSQMIQFYILQEEKIDYKDKEEKESTLKSLSEYYASYYTQMYGQQVTPDQILADGGEEALLQEGLMNKVYSMLIEKNTIKENIVEQSEAETEGEAEEEAE